MTITPVLMHKPPTTSRSSSCITRSMRDHANRVSIAVSATVNGVHIAVEPIGAVSVNIAREVTRQILSVVVAPHGV